MPQCQTCNYYMNGVNEEPCNECKMKNRYEPIHQQKKNDVITSPGHYTQGKIQPLDYIEANRFLGCHEANIIKYVTRFRFKNGVEDLKKARYYLDRLIACEEAVAK